MQPERHEESGQGKIPLVRLDKNASFAAGTVGLNNADVGGGLDFTSNVSVTGNVALSSGADVDLGSLQIM